MLRTQAELTVLAVGVVVALGAAKPLSPPPAAGDWALPNESLSSTRAATGSGIDASNVARLKPLWRFRLGARPTFAGVFTANPLAIGDAVYVQDLSSNVFALARRTGRLRWAQRFRSTSGGPNGLAAAGGRLFGNTATSAFALDAATGRRVWVRRLTSRLEQAIDIAPVVADGLVYTSTVGLVPGGKGALYALDAGTGRVVWRFVTIRSAWADPREAGGGGAWWPMSMDERGRVYAGNSNPLPWGGSKRHPNGGAYRGPALYTDSLLGLDGATGKLLWYDQAVPHDIRDYDLAASPILASLAGADAVFGAGKNGRVYAWDRETGRRLWSTPVGVHRNDLGPTLPRRAVTVCPGLYGGVETPMAYAEGQLFVPVVNLCMRGSAVGYKPFFGLEFGAGSGELVALDAVTGRRLWRRRLPSPVFGCATVANDVVFTSTFDGYVYALARRDGSIVWHTRARAGINACPAVAGDLLLVGAGANPPSFDNPKFEVTAYALSG